MRSYSNLNGILVGFIVAFCPWISTEFVNMVERSEEVFAVDRITKDDAVRAINAARKILADDRSNNYVYLHEDLIESNAMVENIIIKLETSALSRQEMIFVGKAYLNLQFETMLAIQHLTCSPYDEETTYCSYSTDEAKDYVNATESRFLRYMRNMLYSCPHCSMEIELTSPNVTATCVLADRKDIAELVTRFSNVIRLRSKQMNATDDEKAILYVLTYSTNLYKFINNQYQVNSGTARSFVEDLNGNYLELYGGKDEVTMDILYNDTALPNSGWYNVTDAVSDNEFKVNISKSSDRDIGVLYIRPKSSTKCSFNIIPDASNRTLQDAVIVLETWRYKPYITTYVIKNNTRAWYDNDVLRVTVGPADTVDDWAVEPSHVYVKCEECMVNADMLIVIENHKFVQINATINELMYLKSYVKKLRDISPNNSFALVMVAKDIWNVVVNFTRVTTITEEEIDGIFNEFYHPFDAENETTSLIVTQVVDYFDQNSDPYREKITVLISEGYEPRWYDWRDEIARVKQLARSREIHFKTIASRQGAGKILKKIAEDGKLFTNYESFNNRFDNDEDVLWTGMSFYDDYCYADSSDRHNEAFYGLVSAQVYNDRSNKWERSDQIKVKRMDQTTITFKSNFLGTFGSNVFAVPPKAIDFEDVIVDFEQRLQNSPYVLIVNVSLFILTIIAIVILRRFDLQDQLMWRYLPVVGNPTTLERTYYVSVHTGVWSSRKLTSSIYVILKGTRGETKARQLYDGIRKKNFSRWTLSNFILTTDTDIGVLQELRIWHDNKGSSPGWYLDKILIANESERYVFLCGNWLSSNKGNCKCYRKLRPAKVELSDGSVLFDSLTRFSLFDDYLWLSMFSRPNYSRFSRVQRLVCIMSMLYLSMLCNAMWFNGSGEDTTSGIEIGPLVITYREVFVGLASSVITLPPTLAVSFIFRKRKLKDVKDLRENISGDAILPWWSIFIGYGIALVAFLSGSLFTIFYSLQWGGETSTEWLTAFVLGTTQNVLFFEPFKVIILASFLVCLCQTLARTEVTNMAPYGQLGDEASETISDPDNGKVPDWPGATQAKKETLSSKTALLDRKLYEVYKGIIVYTVYISIVAVICGHNAITASYQQNHVLRKTFTPRLQINTSQDMWTWLIHDYADLMYPKRYVNNGIRLLDARSYMFDDVSYRVGLSNIRQARVKGYCEIPEQMRSITSKCRRPYSEEDSDRTDFCPGWTSFLENCRGKGFDYSNVGDNVVFPIWGKHGFYDAGGYSKLLDPSKSDVRNDLFNLGRKEWIDERTRLVTLETILLNINSKLFTLLQIVFEFSSMGGIDTEIKVETMRLYPYVDSFDYVVLAIQLLFVFITICRVVLLSFQIWKVKRRCCSTAVIWINLLSVSASVTAVVTYAARILETISVVEEIVNNPDKYVTFEAAVTFDFIFKICISLELFLSVLKLLKPLTFSYYLYLMRSSIVTSAGELASFAFIIMVGMTAYAGAFMLSNGRYTAEFKDFGAAYSALFKALLSHITYKEVFGPEPPSAAGKVVFCIFVFSMAIFTVNIFIAILTDSFRRVQQSMDKKEENEDTANFDRELNEHFWRKVDARFEFLLNLFTTKESSYPPAKDNFLPDDNGVMKSAVKLDNIVYKICEFVMAEEQKDKDFNEACHQIKQDY